MRTRASLAAGVNPKVVSERLGHSSVAFTLDSCTCHAQHAARPRLPSCP